MVYAIYLYVLCEKMRYILKKKQGPPKKICNVQNLKCTKFEMHKI